MRALLTMILIVVCASSAIADGLLTGEMTPDMTFQRFLIPAPYNVTHYNPDCALVADQSPMPTHKYTTWCIQVTDDQPVGLEVTMFPNPNSVLAIFCGEFDPDHPTDNMIAFNDQSVNGGGLSYIDPAAGVVLDPGATYIVVAAHWDAFGPPGPVQITTTDNILECGTVSDQDTNWGGLKSLYR
jgi:hypothetical protein